VTHADTAEYRVAHLRERLVSGPVAEMGVRIELQDDSVVLSGTVSNTACREEVLRIAEEVLGSVPWQEDLMVVGRAAPDHPEELT